MAAAAGQSEEAGADPPGSCPGADSGHVSQSHSSASGLGEPEDEDAVEASLSATAAAYSAYLLADRSLFSEQVRDGRASGERVDASHRTCLFAGLLEKGEQRRSLPCEPLGSARSR